MFRKIKKQNFDFLKSKQKKIPTKNFKIVIKNGFPQKVFM